MNAYLGQRGTREDGREYLKPAPRVERLTMIGQSPRGNSFSPHLGIDQ